MATEITMKTIQTRISIRTFEDHPVDAMTRAQLEALVNAPHTGPFGNKVRFKLVDASKATRAELGKLVSYGNIKGARLFLAGAVKKGAHAMEDYGYCMEALVLQATEMGLGTVWLGGSLNRSTFSEKLETRADEVIPAISPVGKPAVKRSTMDKVVRTLSKGATRKPFETLFFSGNAETPLDKDKCGKYHDLLEAVRLAPSASNMQPWRIMKSGNDFLFYMDESPSNKVFKDIHIQNNDMGIAMYHFETMAKAKGITGSWQVEKNPPAQGKWVYIVTWKA